MRSYLQHLIVLTTLSLVIILSYLSLAFSPDTVGNGAGQTIASDCDESILSTEAVGVESIGDRRLRDAARWRIQAAADDICESARLFAADPAARETALFPFRLTAHAEYHAHGKYRGIRVQFYSETGGAHGNVNYYTKTVTSRNDDVSLAEVLADHDVTDDAFVAAMLDSLTERGEIPFIVPLTSVEQAEYWHITDRGLLSVTFPPFALAPFAYGTLEATLDLETLAAK